MAIKQSDLTVTKGDPPLADPHGLLNLLSYSTQDHQPSNATAPCWIVPPTSIINQENTPITGLPTGQSYGDNFSIKIPSSQICLGLCEVDKNSPGQLE